MEAVVDEFELPPLEPRMLQAFGDSIPEEVLKPFIRVLGGYRSFSPPLSTDERMYRLAELAVLSGNAWAALEATLYVKSSDAPVARLSRILERLRARGLRSEREIQGAAHYLSYLLAGSSSVRAATLAALQQWTNGPLARAVEHILPELEDDEQRALSRRMLQPS